MTKKIFLLLITVTLFNAVFSQEKTSASKHKDATITELKKVVEAKKNVIILDVRTPEEVAEGKIKGATVIDWNDKKFAEQINQLDKNKIVYVYCASGRRSKLAQEMLIEKGFVEVHNVLGGMNAWKDAGHETVKE